MHTKFIRDFFFAKKPNMQDFRVQDYLGDAVVQPKLRGSLQLNYRQLESFGTTEEAPRFFFMKKAPRLIPILLIIAKEEC